MYFSKQKKQTYIDKILTTFQILYKMEITTGDYNIDNLTEIIDYMFNTWNKIMQQKQNNFAKNFSGYLRRFIIKYNTDTKTYTPSFLFLLLTSSKVKKPVDYHLELNTKIGWFRAWANTTKSCNNITCNINAISKDDAIWELTKFIETKPIDIHAINKKSPRYIQIKQILEKHRIFAESGVFKTNKEKEI